MIKKTPNSFIPYFMLLLTLFHMGTIRRDEDPILKAQTDPISLQQKLEETKDGVKGAPTPSFRYYEKEDFFAKNPMKSAKEDIPSNVKVQSDLDAITEVQTGVLEEVPASLPEPKDDMVETTSKQEVSEVPKEEDDWWMEDET